MTRNDIQKEALELVKSNNRVIFQWCTSLGKSRAAIESIKYFNTLTKEPLKVLLIVAELAHKKNWSIEFIKWNASLTNVTTECYASLGKYKNTNWDIIIFDEAHHLGTDLKIDVLRSLKADHIILLSATLPESIIQSVTQIFGEFKIFTITLQQAIDWGILPKPKIYLIPLTLDNSKYNCTIIEEWGRKDKRVTYKCTYYERWKYMKDRIKYPNVTLEISCTQQQKYNYLTDQSDYWKKRFFNTKNEAIKNKWLQIGSKRKRFLGECKTDIVKVLLSKIRNKRYICFCASIEQADLLGGSNAIHSNKDNPLQIIDLFNNKVINSLFAVDMLQEGQNLVDIEAGIIIQLDGQERAFIQKFGRSMRADDPIQFIFYYKDTRDTEYLDNVLEGINNNYIRIVNNLLEL